jgi:hypothetical protein
MMNQNLGHHREQEESELFKRNRGQETWSSLFNI